MEIEGFENYLIFENGDIVNVNTGLKLKHSKNMYGYLKVCLYKNGKKSFKQIHRLLAQAYIPNLNNKPQVDHINRIRDDNRLENLRWVTRSENCSNKGIDKNNKLGYKNIRFRYVSFEIKIIRNGITYRKNKKTLEEAIKQRDLMISMWS
jgi:hypothetical protein